MLFCSFRRKPKILTGGMFWWLSPFCEAVTSHHPPRWAPLPWPHSLSSHASQVLLPRTLFSQGGCCPIHGMLLQGPALFLQNKDHHLEHCTFGTFIVSLLSMPIFPTGRKLHEDRKDYLAHLSSPSSLFMAHTGEMLSKGCKGGRRHLLHQSCWDRSLKTGFLICWTSLPLHNSSPSSFIHSKCTKKDTHQRNQTEPGITNTPGWPAAGSEAH